MIGVRQGERPNAQAKNVYELFTGKTFRVPDYQRTYSWEKEHWQALWNDIKEGLSTKTEHYWGTITLRDTGESIYCKERAMSLRTYELVDGQQRVATLYLLLLGLCRAGKTALQATFIKTDGIYRLELGNLNNQFLKDLVDKKNPEPHPKTNRLLKDALDYFENQIRMGIDLDELCEYLQGFTFSLEFAVRDQTLAVKAFESLNDRGKDLTWLDKTKSYLMFLSMRYLNGTADAKINEIFGRVFLSYDFIKETGDSEGISYIRSKAFSEDELLRLFYHYFAYFAILEYKPPIAYDYDASVDDVLQVLLKKSFDHLKHDPDLLKSFVTEFLESLNRCVQAFKTIVDKSKTDHTYRRLFVFLGPHARVYPLAVSLEAEGFLDQQMLDMIERLDLRVYKIRGTEPRAALYRDVVCLVKMTRDVNRIRGSIKNFVDQFMPDAQFGGSLSQSLYGNPAVKYILWQYEKDQDPSFDDANAVLYRDLEIDHVFPQTPTFNFPAHSFDDGSSYFLSIDKLGNLTLLEKGLNGSAYQKMPEKKPAYYQQSKVAGTKKLGFFIDNRGFTKEDIDARNKAIIDFCIRRW